MLVCCVSVVGLALHSSFGYFCIKLKKYRYVQKIKAIKNALVLVYKMSQTSTMYEKLQLGIIKLKKLKDKIITINL